MTRGQEEEGVISIHGDSVSGACTWGVGVDLSGRNMDAQLAGLGTAIAGIRRKGGRFTTLRFIVL